MSEAEQVYTTQQVANRLGIGAAMLRRYAQALERVTGEEIPQTRRDGRQFGQTEVDILVAAKTLVDAHHGLNIEAAIRMTLDNPVEPTLTPILPSSAVDVQALVAALEAAYKQANEPILAELQELRQEVKKLREDSQQITQQVEAPKVHRIIVVPVDSEKEQLEQRNRELELELQMVERHNDDLGKELERRRIEVEAAQEPRQWWRRWF